MLLSFCGANQEQSPSANHQSTEQQDQDKRVAGGPKQPDSNPAPFDAILTIRENATICTGTLCELYSATTYKLHLVPEKDNKRDYTDSKAQIRLKSRASYSATLEFSDIPFTADNEFSTDTHIIVNASSGVKLSGHQKTIGLSKDGLHSLSFKFIVPEMAKVEILAKAPKQLDFHLGFYKGMIGYPFLSIAVPMQFEE